MKKLAVTGSLAAGKSTICQLLKQKGAYCVSADEIVSQFLDIHHPIAHRLIDLLGSDIVTADGLKLNRKILADRLFHDPDRLALVEQIMHPEVYRQIQKEYREAPKQAPVFAAEVPLLYEVGWQSWFNAVLFVDAPEGVRLQRFLSRSGARVDDFKARQARLLDNEEKKIFADYILDTNADLADVSHQLDVILQQLLAKT